jgi:23S rRNA pseudouridine2605 synthase
MQATPKLRLSLFLARCGIASRRRADAIIEAGSIKVNNIRVIDPYYRVDPSKDSVTYYNKKVVYVQKHVYQALYKPVGYLSDLADSKNRRLAMRLLQTEDLVFPVGRMDYNSEGLMLFTNDGDFANHVMHPRYEVEKEYLVKLKGILDERCMQQAVLGVSVDGEHYRVDRIGAVSVTREHGLYRVIVHEGKNRMIRKVADALAHPVLKLKRVRIGPVRLGALKPGESRALSEREVFFFLGKPLA